MKGDKPAHGYAVLRLAKAAAPPLALARAGALLLQNLHSMDQPCCGHSCTNTGSLAPRVRG